MWSRIIEITKELRAEFMTHMEKLLEDNANGKDDPINFVKTRYLGVISRINHKEEKAKKDLEKNRESPKLLPFCPNSFIK